jgi:hypothetical protein
LCWVTAPSPVDHQVVSQRVQPRHKWLALPAESVDRRPRLQEDLLSNVLGIGPVANSVVHIAVHGAEKQVVQFGESSLIAPYGALHERGKCWLVWH